MLRGVRANWSRARLVWESAPSVVALGYAAILALGSPPPALSGDCSGFSLRVPVSGFFVAPGDLHPPVGTPYFRRAGGRLLFLGGGGGSELRRVFSLG